MSLVGVPLSPVGGSAPDAVRGGMAAVAPTLSRTVITDEQGRFSFAKMPAGQFNITVNRSQFLPWNYGQKKPGGPGSQLRLNDGEQVKVTAALVRGGVISGTVLGPDGDPQPGARVQAWRYQNVTGVVREMQANTVIADDRGVYRMFNLTPGDYVIGAAPNASDLMVMTATTTVADDLERAIMSSPVTPPGAPGFPATITVPNTQPNVGAGSQPPAGYLPTYYGGTIARGDASIVRVTGGDEHPGLDIPVQLITGTNIRVTVSNPLPPNVMISAGLKLENGRAQTTMMRTSMNRGENTVTFRDVAPGRYTVLVQTILMLQNNIQVVNGVAVSGPTNLRPELAPSERLWARVPVVVSGEAEIAASAMLQPGRSISGLVVLEMNRPAGLGRPPVVSQYQVQLMTPGGEPPDFQNTARATVGADGRFTLEGVPPGTYTLRVNGQMKSAIVDSQDTLDFPLVFAGERDVTGAVLTVSDTASEINGVISQATGEPALDYQIVTAATDSRFWMPGSRRIVVTRPMPNGQYTVRGLPEGQYVIAAVSDLEQGGQFDPEFLRAIQTAGIRVTLTEGGKAVQNIRVAR